MKLIKGRTKRGERGQAVVEFAFILPIFLIVLFMVVEFGIGFSRWIVVTNATREAARYAAVQNGDAGTIRTAVKNRAVVTSSGLLSPAGVTVNFVDGPDTNGTAGDRGDSVVVSASLNYPLLTPLGAFVSLATGSITISGCADMRLELGVNGAADDGVTRC